MKLKNAGNLFGVQKINEHEIIKKKKIITPSAVFPSIRVHVCVCICVFVVQLPRVEVLQNKRFTMGRWWCDGQEGTYLGVFVAIRKPCFSWGGLPPTTYLLPTYSVFTSFCIWLSRHQHFANANNEKIKNNISCVQTM